FDEYRETLQKAGLPTPHALYSAIRACEHPRVTALEFPRIWERGYQRCATLQEQFVRFVKQRKQGASREELQKHFIRELGWKKYALDQIILRSPDLLIGDAGALHHKSNLK